MTVRTKTEQILGLRKKATPLYLEAEQKEALALLSAHMRIPQQVFLREGVDLMLAAYAKELRAARKKGAAK